MVLSRVRALVERIVPESEDEQMLFRSPQSESDDRGQQTEQGPEPSAENDADAVEVLTGPDGQIKLEPHLVENCVIVKEKGEYILYVLEVLAGAPEYESLPRIVSQQLEGHSPKLVRCDSQLLRRYYSGQAYRALGTRATDNRARFIELMDHAARIGASDIKYYLRDGEAIAKFQHENYLTDPVFELLGTAAQRFITSAFYFGDNGDTVEQVTADQKFSITDPDKLPGNVQAARGQIMALTGGRVLDVRLIYKQTEISKIGLEGLGFPQECLDDIYYSMRIGAGLVTNTAPTENGKSTTLDAMAEAYYKSRYGRVDIIGIDDTPENQTDAILQTYMPEALESGKDPYAVKGHTSLRMAPHAVKLGEVRTGEAANAAIDIANTGRWVLTTSHQREALRIAQRYVRLGVDPNLAFDDQTHSLWMAQRLAQKLCMECRIKLGDVKLNELEPWRRPIVRDFKALLEHCEGTFYIRGPGCPHCKKKMGGMPGLKGRILLGETIRPDERLCKLLREDYHAARRYLIAETGKSTMRLHGFEYLAAGTVGLEEYCEVASAAELRHDLEWSGRLAKPALRQIDGQAAE